MKLVEVSSGQRVLVDANIVLYAVQSRSSPCRDFLARCASGDVDGFISTVSLAEIAHRRMTQEAQSRGFAGSNPTRTLAQHPELVRQLSIHARDVRDLLDGGLTVEAVNATDFLLALQLQAQHGLLTNDSLNLAVATRLGLQIATADAAFDAVPGLAVYRPDDLVP
jgi:predicted nucleic acid-binding protein